MTLKIVDGPAVIWCRCVSCGVEEKMRHKVGAQYDEPIGWLAFKAVHWPVGTASPGTLFLRLCPNCLVDSLAVTAFRPNDLPARQPATSAPAPATRRRIYIPERGPR